MPERPALVGGLQVVAPYPGLRPFEPHEAEIFFGREQHVDRLLEILQREHFLAVIGPSGSGKSSLVRAGMLPALAAGWLGTGSDWRVVVMRPGDRPFRELARGLLEPTALGAELDVDPHESAPGSLAALVEAELRRGTLGLLHLVRDARSRAAGHGDFNLLVLVDQFEEIFRYGDGGQAAADEATGFVDLLLASRAEAGARVHVALTMRTDFLGHCVRFLDLPEAINRCQYLTPRLHRGQLAAAVRGPARVFGGDVEARVANEAINAVAEDTDQLPVLQHALARMWESAARRDPGAPVITREDLTTTGGIAAALSLHADTVFETLSAERQRLAEALFRAITERGPEAGGRDTRRPVRLAEIARVAGRPWPVFVPVVEAFAREGVNFLTHALPLDETARIDISHEALIRQWPRLQAWVADEAERARDYRRWRERALERSSRSGELLTGADLARAIEWSAGRESWQPTEGWAARYALEADDAGTEFEGTLAYIAESDAKESARRAAEEAAARRKIELDQQRLEAEKRAAEAQAELEREKAVAEREKAEASARERQLAETHARKARRRSLIAVAVAVVAIALAVSTFISLRQTRAAVVLAREAQREAVAAQREAVAGKLVMQSRAMLNGHTRGTSDTALLLAVAGYRLRPDNEADSGLQYALDTAPRLLKVVSFPEAVVAISPDGRIAVTAPDKSLRLWDAVTGQPRGAPQPGHAAPVTSVAFSPDGTSLVSGSLDGVLRLWDAGTGQPRGGPLPGHTGPVRAVAFSPDGTSLVSGGDDRTLRLWDAGTGRARVVSLQGQAGRVRAVAFSPDGKSFVSGSLEGVLGLWDFNTGEPRSSFLLGAGGVTSVTFSPDGKTLVFASDDRMLRLWDTVTRQARGAPLPGHTGRIRTVAFSPDGKTLVSGSDDRTLRLWDAGTGQPRGAPLQGHTDRVLAVAFSPDGKSLVSIGDDRTVHSWDADSDQSHVAPLSGHTASVVAVAFSPDGKTLASGSLDETLRLWDAGTGQPRVTPLSGHTAMALAFSPDGKTLVSGGSDGPLHLWDAGTGQPRGAPLRGHTSIVMAVAVSPDGKTLASGSVDGGLRLWDADTGQPRKAPQQGHAGVVRSVAFSPDGKSLVSGGDDRLLRLWDVGTGQSRGAPLQGHTGAVRGVAFSPDGKSLASGGDDRTLRLWDAGTGQPRGAPLQGHTGAVTSVAFSPDGRTLVSGGADRTLRLWDAGTGQPRAAPLQGHTDVVTSVAFSPDGKTLVSGGADRTLRLWDAPAAWSDLVCAKLVRNLSHAAWKRYAGDLPYVEQCPRLPVPAD